MKNKDMVKKKKKTWFKQIWNKKTHGKETGKDMVKPDNKHVNKHDKTVYP